jgi:hypothetical protein
MIKTLRLVYDEEIFVVLSFILYGLEHWQSDAKFSAVIFQTAFETAAEPPEGSVIEIEPVLAERSRIHPFPA